MKLLHIETSGANCSATLTDNGTTLATKAWNAEHFAHPENLHLFVETVMTIAGVSPSSLDATAVSAGTGSYVGLCVRVAIAKGLCFTFDKPLIGIPTLQIPVYQVAADYIIPTLDARRTEAYSAVFDNEYRFASPAEAKILDTDGYKEYLSKGKVAFLGDGSTKFAIIYQHPNATFTAGAFPETKDMVPFAIEKYKAANFEDIAYFGPIYLE